MFRILLVEDTLNTLEELRGLLRDIFPDVLVEIASTVAEGRDKIQTAAANNQSFDIAALDFKLPAQKGLNPEIDESLCQEIESKMPETLVIHITAFHEDTEVIKHIAQCHAGKNAPRAELIQKNDGWPKRLLSEIKAYLIEQQLRSLFEKQAETTGARKAVSGGGSLTHMLAALSRDIAAYWPDLDDATKAKVRERFDMIEEKQGVRITLRRKK